jgi:hypothetical protein
MRTANTAAWRGHFWLRRRHHDDAPDRFWRICDANEALNPRDLEAEVGRKIAIPESQE